MRNVNRNYKKVNNNCQDLLVIRHLYKKSIENKLKDATDLAVYNLSTD